MVLLLVVDLLAVAVLPPTVGLIFVGGLVMLTPGKSTSAGYPSNNGATVTLTVNAANVNPGAEVRLGCGTPGDSKDRMEWVKAFVQNIGIHLRNVCKSYF